MKEYFLASTSANILPTALILYVVALPARVVIRIPAFTISDSARLTVTSEIFPPIFKKALRASDELMASLSRKIPIIFCCFWLIFFIFVSFIYVYRIILIRFQQPPHIIPARNSVYGRLFPKCRLAAELVLALACPGQILTMSDSFFSIAAGRGASLGTCVRPF